MKKSLLKEELKKMKVPFEDWDMSHSILDISAKAPQGIFYNRMSASSHTRGNRFAPESTIGLLAWLEAQNCCVINGRSALNLEISKLVQYASLGVAGLDVPSTIAVTKKEDLVLVLGSQKTFAIVLSGNKSSLRKEPSSCLKFFANSIRSKISFLDKSLIERRFLLMTN